MTIKIQAKEAFYVKLSDIKKVKSEMINDFTFRFYEEKACKNCEFLPERHTDVCDNCAAFKGGAQLATPVVVDDKKFVKFPIGNQTALVESLREHGVLTQYQAPKIIRKHPTAETHPMRKKVRFRYKALHKYQKEAVLTLFDKKKGVLKSKPRTGKTVMASALIAKVGGKALVLVSQRDWLVGFYETFCGSLTQKAWSNATGSGVLPEDRRAWVKAGRPRRTVGFCKTLEDFKKHDVCLVTYQMFLQPKGRKILEKIKDMFPVLIVDEIHTGAADKYAIIISKINSEYKIGLSGTPSRKDGRFVLMRNLMGPNLYEAKVDVLKPTVRFVRTNYSHPGKRAQWTTLVSNLEANPARLKLIAKYAVEDAKAGHMVLIPMARVKVIKALTQAINRLYGKDIAKPFYGGVKKHDRDLAIEQARKYKIRVLVGQAKLMSTGINIPRASCIYDTTLSSNLENCEQRVSRILTPYEGKPSPMLRVFLDDMQARRACLRNEWWNCIMPKFKPNLSAKDLDGFKAWLNNKGSKQTLNPNDI